MPKLFLPSPHGEIARPTIGLGLASQAHRSIHQMNWQLLPVPGSPMISSLVLPVIEPVRDSVHRYDGFVFIPSELGLDFLLEFTFLARFILSYFLPCPVCLGKGNTEMDFVDALEKF